MKVLIIDDERAARNEIRRLLAPYPDMEIAGEAANADEARQLIGLHRPAVLFLDIQMPGESGFELLESLEVLPMVVFTTAYDQYALQAFEVSALDYLMKPIREERFARAIEQLRTRATTTTQRVFIKDRDRYHIVSWEEVYLAESLDNYALLCFKDQKVLLKSALVQLEQKLEPVGFFRANRSQLVNLNFAAQIRTEAGRVSIVLHNGTEVMVSERQSVKLRSMGRL